MENNLFRKKSLEHISSPEELHDYMRVTSPKLWMILAATIALLAGFIVYASTATMENTIDISVTIQAMEVPEGYQLERGNTKYSYVTGTLPISQKGLVEPGMIVRIGKETGKVDLILVEAQEQEVLLIIDVNQNYLPLPDGTYDAELVLESTTPISFLWN